MNELYVRFFRMAEREIVEHTGRGIVSFISNSSWLDGLSHSAMRERLMGVFGSIWVDDLHGNRIISEYARDGRTSETVFAMRGSSPGIKVGTAIVLLVRGQQRDASSTVVRYADFHEARAAERRNALLLSLDSATAPRYVDVVPKVDLGRPFKPALVSSSYFDWPTLPDLFPFSVSGVQTKRDEALVDVQRQPLVKRMAVYYDPNASQSLLEATVPTLMRDSNRFQHTVVRSALLRTGFLSDNVVPYLYRPFDLRWVYWEPETKLLGEKSPNFFPHVFSGNGWLLTTGRTRKGNPQPAIYSSRLADINLMDSGVRATPLLVRAEHADLLGNQTSSVPNLSKTAKGYLESLGGAAEELFFHALTILHSDNYRDANAGALRQDWPRIPLPANWDVLRASAALGREVAALLDSETPVPGVTSGTPSPALRLIAAPARLDGQPLGVADFALTAGWGHVGQGGVTMPGKGRMHDRAASADEAAGGLGLVTHDIYLNATACWRHVPAPVWNYTLGGYQVLKKWLSYREQPLLGRALTFDEVKAFASIARRIAALVLLRDRLDANYAAAATAHTSFRHSSGQVMPASAKSKATELGDRVIFAKYSGTSIPGGGDDELLILREEDILAIIDGPQAGKDVPEPPKPEPDAPLLSITSPDDDKAALLNDPRNVPLWFGTNREPTDRKDIGLGFSGRRSVDRSVWHGRCIVNVPAGHALGSTGTQGLKGWWQRWRHGVDDRLRLLSIEGRDDVAFWQAVRAAMDEPDPDQRVPEALLFVHGYRVTFEDAALRAAQLAYDLKIRDTSFFAWPSAGAAAKYTVDEGSAKNATQPLAEFILALDASAHAAGKALHVIAHSMGNRVLLAALQWLVLKGHTPQAIDKIVCAAPDEDAADFVAAMAALRSVGRRRTLYASSKDKPVWLSEVVHGYPRAGRIPPVTLADGLDTVDASDLEATFLGHSDFATQRPLLHDLFSLLKASLEPRDRQGLEPVKTDSGVAYWRIK